MAFTTNLTALPSTVDSASFTLDRKRFGLAVNAAIERANFSAMAAPAAGEAPPEAELAFNFRLSPRRFGLAFYSDPQHRPPVLSEMMPDIDRLIHSVAQRYCDQTTPHLHLDELMGEGRLKLAELLHKGALERQPTRANFFRFFKASLQNQAKSRVQKYRFTAKRTGVKPPPRHERCWENPEENPEEQLRAKQVELSLDDTDLHLQVADESHDTQVWNEVLEEYSALLSEIEQVVLKQMVQPNERALALAREDSYYLKMPGKVVVKIKTCHLAHGLEITTELFNEAVLSIRQKVQNYRAMTDAEQMEKARLNAAISQLKAVFGVQIPPTADSLLVRRLFTVAARDQYTKINAQVAEMLEMVGAKVPRVHRDMISCYGVLYQAYDRRCQSCGLRHACKVEASNAGLTRITLSPKLLGSRQQRSPVVLPTEAEETPVDGSYAEAEILSYLQEYFTRFTRKDEIFYGHNADTADQQVLLFCLGAQMTPLSLRFCSPSVALRRKLTAKAKSWLAPAEATLPEIIALIDQHAKETFDHGQAH